ncbi:MAG: hypothetical protein N2115_03555 [bacterium]|nr:hypothetical protein [bacterium]
MYEGITIRPSQALCLICWLGKNPAGPEPAELEKILKLIEKNPDIPITLRCNAGDIFSFQDIKGGKLFERKMDLDVLQKMDLPPGATLPARILFIRILNRIKTLKKICWFDGRPLCMNADKKYYEKARKMQLSLIVQYCDEFSKSIGAQQAKKQGIRIIIPPRTVDDLEKSKRDSLDAMYRARHTGIKVRPHLLLCALCQFGTGVKPGQAYDNLPELLQLVIKEPDIKIKLVEGADWMMCGPCPSWTKENSCVHSLGKCGLSNQLRDMRVLQKLGFNYGDTVEGWKLYFLIFEKIPSTVEICRFDNPSTSMWHSGCGKRRKNSPEYEKGRKKLIELLKGKKKYSK